MMEKDMITIGNKKYPLRVTMGAIVRFKRSTKKNINEVSTDDIDSFLQFVYLCVSSASNIDGVEFKLSFDDFIDYLEPKDIELLSVILASEAQKKTMKRAKI